MIRLVCLNDLDELMAISKYQLGYILSKERSLHQLKSIVDDPKHHYLLVFEENSTHKILGYVHAEVYTCLYAETYFNVLGLAVADSYQKQGIGKKLMLALEKEAKKRGYEGVRLNSGSTRKGAHIFYEKMGYEGVKTQRRFIRKVRNDG